MLGSLRQFFHDDRHDRIDVVVRDIGHEHKVGAFALEDEVDHWLSLLHGLILPLYILYVKE